MNALKLVLGFAFLSSLAYAQEVTIRHLPTYEIWVVNQWLDIPYKFEVKLQEWMTVVFPGYLPNPRRANSIDPASLAYALSFLTGVLQGSDNPSLRQEMTPKKMNGFLQKMIESGYFFYETPAGVTYPEFGAEIDRLLLNDRSLKIFELRGQLEGYNLNPELQRVSLGILRGLSLLSKLHQSPFAADLQPTIKKLARQIAIQLQLTTFEIERRGSSLLHGQVMATQYSLSFAEATIETHKRAGVDALKLLSEYVMDIRVALEGVKSVNQEQANFLRRNAWSFRRNAGTALGALAAAWAIPLSVYTPQFLDFMFSHGVFQTLAASLGLTILPPLLGYFYDGSWNAMRARADIRIENERILTRIHNIPAWKYFFDTFADDCELYLSNPKNVFAPRRIIPQAAN